MKKTLRLVSLMIVLTLVLASVSILAVGAEESEGGLAPIQNKVQKVVTVVYDDSGSMGQNVNVPNDYQTKPSRADYALYAMKMLMSLLGEGDLLQIVPMNGIGREYLVVSVNENAKTAVIKL